MGARSVEEWTGAGERLLEKNAVGSAVTSRGPKRKRSVSQPTPIRGQM